MVKKISKFGFTLIELIGVIILVGIIALISSATIGDLVAKTRKNTYVIEAKLIEAKVLDNMALTGTRGVISSENVETVLKINLKKDYVGEVETTEENKVVMTLCDGSYCIYKGPYDEESIIIKQNNTYNIHTIEDLVDLSIRVDSGDSMAGTLLLLENDLDFSDPLSYEDAASTAYGDINNDGSTDGLLIEMTTGEGFNPIGEIEFVMNEETGALDKEVNLPFSGMFYGQNYTINNLYINVENEDNEIMLGLFAAIDGSETDGSFVRDLEINGYINLADGNAGLLAGDITDTFLYNINVSGSIENSYSWGTGLVAGGSTVIGSNSTFSKLSSSGTIISDFLSGGILGFMDGGNIYDSFSSADINYEDGASAMEYSYASHLGGLIGGVGLYNLDSTTYIENCQSDSIVYGTFYVGGFVGSISAVNYIENSRSDSTVYGIDRVGGLVGSISAVNYIYNSSSGGTVFAYETGGEPHGWNIGGFLGRMDNSTIYNSFTTTDVNVVDNASGHIGGFIGMIGSTDRPHDNIKVENCYSAGTLNFDGGESSAFIGQNGASSENGRTKYTTIKKVYSISNLTTNASYATGGIVGTNIMMFENSLFSGNINATNAAAGAIAGRLENAGATITNSWYNSDKSLVNVTFANGNPITSSELTEEWFKDVLKFDNNWQYNEGYYPILYKIDSETKSPTRELVENQILNLLE